MPKLKKIKRGKVKRHKFRKALGVKNGFGKPWSADSRIFRVEFSWCNADQSEENFMTHWIECRKIQGEEKNFLLTHYAQAKEQWSERETIESKFVGVYCADWLVKNKDKCHANQAFIFPTTKKGNETIREPIYIIKWTEKLAKNATIAHSNLEIVLKNSIYHRYK